MKTQKKIIWNKEKNKKFKIFSKIFLKYKNKYDIKLEDS
jgi:hypothetical protein